MIDGRNRFDPAGTARARTVTLPAQEEQAPARQEYGRSMPASCEIERVETGAATDWRNRREVPRGASKKTLTLVPRECVASRVSRVRRRARCTPSM
jgi:hypothetical protein